MFNVRFERTTPASQTTAGDPTAGAVDTTIWYADWTLPRGTSGGNAQENRGAATSMERGLARYSTRSRVGAGPGRSALAVARQVARTLSTNSALSSIWPTIVLKVLCDCKTRVECYLISIS